MTIQRQYVLPNCSLLLEGLSTDTSNVLSILANAEFKIVGMEQSLAGGLDFFKAIVGAVNAYCQRLLSGIDHPDHMPSQSSLISVEPGEGQYHRLLVQPELLNSEDKERQPKTITLSTVQLFDMAEAIDQFFADGQTLPEFVVPLAPLARRHVRSQEPLAQRAVPPIIGVATLAAAGLGLFFMPIPEGLEESLTQPAALEETTGNPLETSPPGDDILPDDAAPLAAEEPPDVVSSASEPAAASEPLSAEQLATLQQQMQQQISGALAADTAFEQPLSYDISVAANGDILGYNPLDNASFDGLESTPLPNLTYIPVDSDTVNPVAQFNLTFDTDGTVTVAPQESGGLPDIVTPEAVVPEVVTPEEPEGIDEAQSSAPASSEPSSGTTATDLSSGELPSSVATDIRDPDLIYDLNQGLRKTIVGNMNEEWSGPEVRYRVRLDDSGQVVGYEPANDAAEDYVDDLNLASLVEAADSPHPQLDFLVVLSGSETVEVNPWDGWP
ncbi:DUF4335 domain-containing protein [Leptothoe kymatousa]|uniref:DUF4335 domain-containing protein n=1 Tax=Leptothoe kymatousa TAU-MAC 1615 TaxID=2364775 RepID=A0ABS5Y5R1_9CYAN|nr:DUF4335 domain-containing protein [Leptothoe kymatousa]MBT9312853.1 DUF4335 domain-containing protein [Leptothoe kymatousa TAU-MAC 1615]